jgi:hypothetical protein
LIPSFDYLMHFFHDESSSFFTATCSNLFPISLVTIGVNRGRVPEIQGVAEGGRRTKRAGAAFSSISMDWGGKGVKLFILDKCLELIEALREFYIEPV